MFKKYLILALRNLIRHKVLSFINIAGLAIGITCVVLTLMWVDDEMNFDGFHQNKERIYRILVQRKGTEDLVAVTPGLLAEAVKKEIPEVQYAARVIQNHRNPYRYEEKAFYEDKSYCVDPDFFKIFSFPIVQGNPSSPLEKPEDIVIDEQTAEKYFGKTNPIGKKLRWNNKIDRQVSAVINSMASRSSLQMQILELHTLAERFWQGGYNWSNYVHETYILIEKKSSAQTVEKKIEAVLNHYSKWNDRYYYVHLQPLDDIHLNASVLGSSALTGDRKYTTIFTIVGIFILLIACFNYINISIANSMSRAKEIGIRKVVGTQQGRLVFQFLGEFALSTLIAALLAAVVLMYALPYENQFTGKALAFNARYGSYYVVIFFLTTLMAGSYPAFYVSGFSPEAALKHTAASLKNRTSLRSLLVMFQFAISIVLIICTLLVKEQLSFIQNKKLGFDKDNIIYIPAKRELAQKYESVKSRLMQYPDIRSVAMQQTVPTTTIEGSWVHWPGQMTQDVVLRNTQVTPDWFQTMNIGLKEGRYFSEEFPMDRDAAFILNEAAVNFLQLKTPVGMDFQTAGRTGKIVGVVNDSYFRSLHNKIQPLVFMELNDYQSIDLFGVILVKYSSNNIPALLENMKTVWYEYTPNQPFEYHFLDQTIDQQYVFEKRLSSVFMWFSLLAITISISGVLGMAVLLMEQRTKEIGIRKVLGASVSRMIVMITRDFIKWIVLSNIIAWPIAYYFMNKWLQDFAYRIDISWWIFILSGGIALLIALVTVSCQAIKAAIANPIESLRYE